jgi:hypothetical protein
MVSDILLCVAVGAVIGLDETGDEVGVEVDLTGDRLSNTGDAVGVDLIGAIECFIIFFKHRFGNKTCHIPLCCKITATKVLPRARKINFKSLRF